MPPESSKKTKTSFPLILLCYNSLVPNWAKTIIAILLIPFCIGAVSALIRVVGVTGSTDTEPGSTNSVSRPAHAVTGSSNAVIRSAHPVTRSPKPVPGNADTLWVALLGGAACWLSIYLLLPKPMRLYVLGHELTHVLWTWLFGGRVKKFKASSRGGHVVITRSNFLIVLAPYFFPLYAAIVGACFSVGHLVWNWTLYVVWFHLLLGAAYAFHVTLTWNALQTHQTDISSQGYFFSAVIVFLGNIMVLMLGIPLLSSGKVSFFEALGWWMQETGAVLRWIGKMF